MGSLWGFPTRVKEFGTPVVERTEKRLVMWGKGDIRERENGNSG